MITQKEREAIQHYFKKFPKWTIWVLVLSIALLPLHDIGVGGIGLIGIITGLLAIIKWFRKITDQQFDHLREQSLKGLRTIAMEKLRLSEDDLVRSNERIYSPIYWNIGGASLGLRRGKDKKLRYTPIHVSMIFFTEHKLCLYQCALDLTTGNPLNVASSKYYYEDIVSIETQSHARTIPEGDIKKEAWKYLPKLKHNIVNGVVQINQSEQFVLTTKGGNSIKIQLPDYTILNYGIQGTLHDSRSDAAIAAVEAMLDSKKSVNYN